MTHITYTQQNGELPYSAAIPGEGFECTIRAVSREVAIAAADRAFPLEGETYRKGYGDGRRAVERQLENDQVVRFCPDCGHVGEVAAPAFDCCPDGGHARMVRPDIAALARSGFRAAIGIGREAPVLSYAQHISDEKALFDAKFPHRDLCFDTSSLSYFDDATDSMWDAWQVRALAALPAGFKWSDGPTPPRPLPRGVTPVSERRPIGPDDVCLASGDLDKRLRAARDCEECGGAGYHLRLHNESTECERCSDQQPPDAPPPPFTADEIERLRGLIADPPVRPHVTAAEMADALRVASGASKRAEMYEAGRIATHSLGDRS